MIERIIWQTYETPLEELPRYGVEGIGTWKHQNPEWEHRYMSGEERENFFKSEFDSKVYDTYMRMPLGVMKAGMWRFGILYIYGGVYADLDTHCQVPISRWLDDQYDLVLDIEGDTPWWATQVIASRSGHPFIKNALDLCIERAKDGLINNTHMVHYYTDVQMFTDSLFQSLQVTPYQGELKEMVLQYNQSDIAKQNKMFTFGGNDARRLLDRDVKHLYWGDDRNNDGYIAWKKDPIVNASYPNGFDVKNWGK